MSCWCDGDDPGCTTCFPDLTDDDRAYVRREGARALRELADDLDQKADNHNPRRQPSTAQLPRSDELPPLWRDTTYRLPTCSSSIGLRVLPELYGRPWDDRAYRYLLTRRFSRSEPWCAWIGLNPSTGDERADDATIRKCVGFTRRWGMGGIILANLFAWRSRDPHQLAWTKDPVGPDNDTALRIICNGTDVGRIVLAWGPGPAYKKLDKLIARRGAEVRELMMQTARAPVGHLGELTANGSPRHPLMPSYDTPFVPYADPEGD
jgi:hypothetical protein